MPKIEFKAVGVEFMASMFYVLFFTFSHYMATSGATAAEGGNKNTPYISFGLAAFIYGITSAVGDLGGCHMNPCITLTMLITKNIDAVHGILYIVAQIFGGILGAAFKLAFLGADDFGGNLYLEQTRKPTPAPTASPVSRRRLAEHESNHWYGSLESSRSGAFFIEFCLCVILCLVLLNTGMPNKNVNGPLAYAFSFLALSMASDFMGGAVSLNPARALATSIFETTRDDDTGVVYDVYGDKTHDPNGDSWWAIDEGGEHFYVWFVAPLLAAPVAAALYFALRGTLKAGAAKISQDSAC